MTDRIQFIKDADEVTRQCRQRIAELRARIPIVAALHRCLRDWQDHKRKPTVKLQAQLAQALHLSTELPARLVQFNIEKQGQFTSGYVKFRVQHDLPGSEEIRLSARVENDVLQADTVLMGYANDAAIADALEAKLPGIGEAVRKYNDALQALCDASNFGIDPTLGAYLTVHPLSSHFQWYELAGDVGKSMELRKRGIFVR